jgi:hypothetical protein
VTPRDEEPLMTPELPFTPIDNSLNAASVETEVSSLVIEKEKCNFPDLDPQYSDTKDNWALRYINDLSNK